MQSEMEVRLMMTSHAEEVVSLDTKQKTNLPYLKDLLHS